MRSAAFPVIVALLCLTSVADAACGGAAGSRFGIFRGRRSAPTQTVQATHYDATVRATTIRQTATVPLTPMAGAVRASSSQWKPGPLPAGTWNWGAVQTADSKNGFFFADFRGDHVITPDGRRIEPAAITLYNNSIELPPR